MKIALGADHAGFELKEKLKNYLLEKAFSVEDCGTFSAESVDYPKFAHAVAKLVSDGQCSRGIMVDGAGIGSCITANKVPGVRAALCYDLSSARNSREHNDSNVLTLGAGLIGFELVKQITDVWLATECTAERHKKRVSMIADIEKGSPPPSPESPLPSQTSAEMSPEDLRKIAELIQTMIGATYAAAEGSYGHATCIDSQSMQNMIRAGASRIGYTPNGKDIPSDIAQTIDHTLLKPQATPDEIRKLCEEAKTYQFSTVCVNPYYVKLCSELLRGTPVKVCSVVGFPFGATSPEIKAMETRRAIREGAKEIDMVINIGAMKAGDDETVLRDIRAVVEACREGRALSKVIIEAALLTDEEKVWACQLAKKARADFVKTSTGFGPSGATVHDVALMREAVKGTKMGVKAAGGIRSLADAKKMIEAGATRIGASVGVKIAKEAKHITVSD